MMRTRDAWRTALVLVLAFAGALAPLTRLTRDTALPALGIALVAALAALGAGLRTVRVAPAWVHGAQAALLSGLMVATGWHLRGAGGVHPGLAGAAQTALDQMRQQAPPLAASPEVRWLFLTAIGVLLLVTDLLLTTLAAPAWSIAALATLHLVPALTIAGRLPWWHFTLLGAGWLALMANDTIITTGSWARSITSDTVDADPTGNRDAGSVRTPRRPDAIVAWVGLLLGVPALATTLVIGSLAAGGGSDGPQRGNTVQMHDPTINLSRDLTQPDNAPVLTYTTSTGEGLHLRLAALTVLTHDGWNFPATGVSLLQGPLPPAPGSSAGLRPVSGRVQVGSFASQYLPLPYAATSYTLDAAHSTGIGARDGDWRHNPATMEVMSTAAAGTSPRGGSRRLAYDFTASVEEPDPAAFASARAGVPAQDADVVTHVPDGVPDSVVDLARQITRGAPSDAVKAQRLQAWLADPRRFTYSPMAPGGNGIDAITTFLTDTHSGYCIHFASAMALMARLVGIPSRIASGFLPGHRVGDHWEVDTHDLHAWPELYFQDYGWVRFEPTVAITTGPAWTHPGPHPESPQPGTTQPGTTQPGTTASASTPASAAHPGAGTAPGSRTSHPRDTPHPSTRPGAAVGGGAAPTGATHRNELGSGWNHTGWLVGGGALALGLACLPLLWRRRQRERRLAPHADHHAAICDAWEELRATRIDLGHGWPSGSPRAVHDRLAPALDADSAGALRRLAGWVEQSRYAPALTGAPQGLDADVARVRDAWLRSTPRGRRIIAALLPRSLWRRPPPWQ